MGPCGLEHDLGRGNRTLELVRRIRDETTLRVHRRLDSRKQIVKGPGEAREVPVAVWYAHASREITRRDRLGTLAHPFDGPQRPLGHVPREQRHHDQ